MKATATVKDALDLSIKPGTYVRVNDKYGNNVGVIDEVFYKLGGYGFVTSDENGWWCGRVVAPEAVEILWQAGDIEQARTAAFGYFEREANSLSRRMKMQYEHDDPKRLQNMLDYCIKWLRQLY